jgi:hypothetical protein
MYLTILQHVSYNTATCILQYCNMYLTILQHVSYPVQYYIDSSAEFICLSIALMITGRAATTITWDLE